MRRTSRSSRPSTSHSPVLNDGRPDFAVEPVQWAGADLRAGAGATLCDVNGNRRVASRRSVTIEIPVRRGAWTVTIATAIMASIGVQRQIGSGDGVRGELRVHRRPQGGGRPKHQSAYNAATGANYPFTDRAATPFPEWGMVLGEFMRAGRTTTGWRRRSPSASSNRWQANATYTLSGF